MNKQESTFSLKNISRKSFRENNKLGKKRANELEHLALSSSRRFTVKLQFLHHDLSTQMLVLAGSAAPESWVKLAWLFFVLNKREKPLVNLARKC